MPAQKTDPMLTDSEEQLYTVMVDGEEMQLTLEQLIAAAEQGLSRANQSARTDGMAGGQPGMTADGRNGDGLRPFPAGVSGRMSDGYSGVGLGAGKPHGRPARGVPRV